MPTKWPCDTAIACPCSDNPLFNISSENPDPFTFFSRRFFPNPVQLNDPPGVFTTPSCGQACESAISQEDADACALRQATLCTQPDPPPDHNDPVLFSNQAISCQADCPDGPPFVLSVLAGTYLARTQELADTIARSFCQADVIRLRECHMPPPGPPSTVCPVVNITTASPINANEGDDVTMNVNYTYNSAQMLMFVWFLDGIATYTTPSSSITLLSVGPADAGQYILGIFASGCFPVFSPPITLNVTAACPPEVGPDAPSTLDLAHPLEWETYTFADGDFSLVVSSVGGCNPTGLRQATPTNGLDHSPGNYGFRYIAGTVRIPAFDGGCGAQVWIEPPGESVTCGLVNTEHNVDAPVGCAFQYISSGSSYGWFSMPGDPPPGAFIPPVGGCFTDSATAEFFFNIGLTGAVLVESTYPPDEIEVFPHTNTGGPFKVYLGDLLLAPPQFVDSPLQLKVLQIEGQIVQPRKVKIDDFGTVAAQLSDPNIGNFWDGTINTRTTYNSTTLLWSEPAIGGFGGATLEWFNTHPTSANGFGWKLKIFGPGPTLVWQGIKGIDTTSEGRYYRDDTATPTGPACCTVSDNSTIQWFP